MQNSTSSSYLKFLGVAQYEMKVGGFISSVVNRVIRRLHNCYVLVLASVLRKTKSQREIKFNKLQSNNVANMREREIAHFFIQCAGGERPYPSTYHRLNPTTI